MEPSLIKNNKESKRQAKFLLVITILALSIFIGTSYSILTSTDESEEVITFQAGELKLSVKTDDNDSIVNLPDELPKTEAEVETPVILNLKNNGSLTICEYRLKLIEDTEKESNLSTNYIRYSISVDNGVTYKESKLLSETDNQIYVGFDLKPDATKIIYVKVWLDESALDNEEVLSKDFYGKIDAELLQRCEASATEHIKSTMGQTGGIIGVTNDNQKVTTDSSNIREYRYSGLGVNNYVTFNNETWRILGIFKDEADQEHIKIVRNEVLPASAMPDTYVVGETTFKIRFSSSEATAYWDYDGSNYNNNWTDAGLMNWLNSKGTENGYLKTLSNAAQNMIAETKYYLGNVWVNDTAVQSYESERKSTKCNNINPNSHERECYVWPDNEATWIGNIALMYQSDYGFSMDSSYWSTKKLNADYISFIDTSWLQKEANRTYHEWFLSPTSYSTNCVSSWGSVGSANYFNVYEYDGVRPSLYLKSDTKIMGGNGTSTEPYILQI